MESTMTKPFDSLDISHRQAGWQIRLVYLIDEELSKPFDWVTASCIDMILASVLACHGPQHPVFKHIPKYTTSTQAISTLKKLGGLETVISKYFLEVPRSHAFDGDIGLFKKDIGEDEVEFASGLILDGQIVGKNADANVRNIAYYLPLSLGYKFYRV